MMSLKSVVTVNRENAGACSYCDYRSDDGRVSYSMVSGPDSVSVDDYQALVDVGWGRMGHRLTRAVNEKGARRRRAPHGGMPVTDTVPACCPNYGIRLDVHCFVPSSSQAAALRLFARHFRVRGLAGADAGAAGAASAQHSEATAGGGGGDGGRGRTRRARPPPALGGSPSAVLGPRERRRLCAAVVAAARAVCSVRGVAPPSACADDEGAFVGLRTAPAHVVASTGSVVASTAVAFALAAQGGTGLDAPRLAALLAERVGEAGGGVRAVAAGGYVNLWCDAADEDDGAGPAGACVMAYEAGGGSATDDTAGSKSGALPGGGAGGGGVSRGEARRRCAAALAGEVLVTHSRVVYRDEDFALYKKFNVEIHGKDPAQVTPRGYTGFLAESCVRGVGFDAATGAAVARATGAPGGGGGGSEDEDLARAIAESLRDAGAPPAAGDSPGGPDAGAAGAAAVDALDALLGDLGGAAAAGYDLAAGFGSFQQRYYVDGAFVAMGVVDVLPTSFISVYFMYDPAFRAIEIAKYSALREIQWARLAARRCPTLRYYDMCSFIPGCHRMDYKVRYGPCEILCPVTDTWVPWAAVADRFADGRAKYIALVGDPDPAAHADVLAARAAASEAAVYGLSVTATPRQAALVSDVYLMGALMTGPLLRWVREVRPYNAGRFIVDVHLVLDELERAQRDAAAAAAAVADGTAS